MFQSRRLAPLLFVAFLALGCHEVHLDFEGVKGEIDVYDDLFSVSVPDEQNAVSVGYYGAAYWTDDGGESWHKGHTGTHAMLYSVSMADAKHGWAVGQRGLILRTEDGGRTWTPQSVPSGSYMRGLRARREKIERNCACQG